MCQNQFRLDRSTALIRVVLSLHFPATPVAPHSRSIGVRSEKAVTKKVVSVTIAELAEGKHLR
jgi:hypothetical protein